MPPPDSPFPDAPPEKRAHRDGAERAGLQHQAHGRLGRDQAADGGDARLKEEKSLPKTGQTPLIGAISAPPAGCMNPIRPKGLLRNHHIASRSWRESFRTASAAERRRARSDQALGSAAQRRSGTSRFC